MEQQAKGHAACGLEWCKDKSYEAPHSPLDERSLAMLTLFATRLHPSAFLQVRIYDLTQYEHCPDDVLVLGTDGLWDVITDQEVASIVLDVLMSYEPNDPCR